MQRTSGYTKLTLTPYMRPQFFSPTHMTHRCNVIPGAESNVQYSCGELAMMAQCTNSMLPPPIHKPNALCPTGRLTSDCRIDSKSSSFFSQIPSRHEHNQTATTVAVGSQRATSAAARLILPHRGKTSFLRRFSSITRWLSKMTDGHHPGSPPSRPHICRRRAYPHRPGVSPSRPSPSGQRQTAFLKCSKRRRRCKTETTARPESQPRAFPCIPPAVFASSHAESRRPCTREKRPRAGSPLETGWSGAGGVGGSINRPYTAGLQDSLRPARPVNGPERSARDSSCLGEGGQRVAALAAEFALQGPGPFPRGRHGFCGFASGSFSRCMDSSTCRRTSAYGRTNSTRPSAYSTWPPSPPWLSRS